MFVLCIRFPSIRTNWLEFELFSIDVMTDPEDMILQFRSHGWHDFEIFFECVAEVQHFKSERAAVLG